MKLKNEVEFEIEKKCKTCILADDNGRSPCFACIGWRPKPKLVPKGYWVAIGPRVMYDPQIELPFETP